MNRIIFILFIALSSCSKNEKTEQKPSILSIKEMSDLATVEYTVSKIIRASDDKTWFKIGDRRILMSCEAQIKAGIDLSEVTEKSFSIDNKNITLRLPPPKLISLSLPPEKIITEYEEVGLFREKFNSNDREDLAVQAEQQIRNSISQLGILEQAKVNTSILLTNFLQKLGYEQITISYNGDIKTTAK